MLTQRDLSDKASLPQKKSEKIKTTIFFERIYLLRILSVVKPFKLLNI